MIIDTSAFICLIKQEPLAPQVLARLMSEEPRRMSAVTASELFAFVTCTVAPGGWSAVDRLMSALGIEMVAYDAAQVALFRQAYTKYGRGGHNTSRAHLNLGDCFSYALAMAFNEPLLFIGDDFTHTDVVSAMEHPHKDGC